MRKHLYTLLIFALLILLGSLFFALLKGITPEKSQDRKSTAVEDPVRISGVKIKLPDTRKDGGMSLNETLTQEKLHGSLSNEPISVDQVSQLLWSAQVAISEDGLLNDASADDAFPLKLFLIVNKVTGILEGLYSYDPIENTLELIFEKDVTDEMMKTSRKSLIVDGSVVIVFAEDNGVRTRSYEDKSESILFIRIGHAAQNVRLQATALGLGTIPVYTSSGIEIETTIFPDYNINVKYLMQVGKVE